MSLFVVAQVGSALHALGYGPLAGLESFTDVQAAAQLKLFLATVAVASLLLASRSSESETFQDLAASREQLVAAVSHELRTPLTAIVGFSEVLLHRSGRLDEQARQAAAVIHRNQIVTNLLDNALRHGAPPVEVSVRTDRGHSELSVIDHGVGVPAWFEPRLFDDFSQAVNGDQHRTRSRSAHQPDTG